MTAVETSATLRQAPIVPSNTHDVLWPELDKPNPRSAPLGNRSINEQSLSCSPHLRKYHHASGRAHTTVRGNFGRAYAGWRSKPGTRTELEYDAEARELWRRFLEIPAYQNYRTRQPKKGKKKEEAVWPDRREWAFFRAIARFPPVGREQTQIYPGGKRMGRNEIVAEFLARTTGSLVFRKQVSSHIQVLKDYVGTDMSLLSYLLSPTKMTKHKQAGQAQFAKLHSMHPVHMPRLPQGMPLLQNLEHDIKGQKRTIELHTFDMKIVSENDPRTAGHPVHFYTESSDHSAHDDVKFNSWQHCVEEYPQFGLSSINVLGVENFVAANASISLPSTGTLNGQHRLEICMMLRGFFDPKLPFVESKTTFFDNGKPEEPKIQQGEVIVSDTMKKGGACMYQVPFSSSTWVQYLSKLGSTLSRAHAERTRDLDAGEDPATKQLALMHMEQGVATTLRNLTAVQEIFVRDKKYKDSKTLVVVHWSFRQAAAGEFGRTIWQNMIVPRLEDGWDQGADSLSDIQSFDFGALGDDGCAESGAPPQLQSPIEFDTEPGAAWSATVTAANEYSTENQLITCAPPNEYIYPDAEYHHMADDSQSSYDITPTTVEEFDFASVDYGASQLHAEPMIAPFHHPWNPFENVYDPSLTDPTQTAHRPSHHPCYPTPPSVTDMDKFASFGLDYPMQAHAGAQLVVKEEQGMEYKSAGHGCLVCVSMPYCTCSAVHAIKHSDSQGSV